MKTLKVEIVRLKSQNKCILPMQLLLSLVVHYEHSNFARCKEVCVCVVCVVYTLCVIGRRCTETLAIADRLMDERIIPF